MYVVQKRRITAASLLVPTKLKPIYDYICSRTLRWAGHVARMGPDRLPRRFITAWVFHRRPRGRPQFTFGHALARHLCHIEELLADDLPLARSSTRAVRAMPAGRRSRALFSVNARSRIGLSRFAAASNHKLV